MGDRLGDRLSINESKILSLLRGNADITISGLAKTLTISTTAVENNLSKLKSKGIIKRIGGDKGGHWEILNKDVSTRS